MPSVRLEDLSPFGRLALKLDNEFAELSRLSGQMSGVNIESDGGLDEAIRILNRVAKYGESLAATMDQFAGALQESRGKAEAATKLVAERAELIQKRRQRQDQLQDKLTGIREEVRMFGEGLSGLNQPAKGELSPEDKSRIAAELEKIEAPLVRFIEAVQALKAEAAGANFRRLERQADSMIDSLQASRRKIAQALGPK